MPIALPPAEPPPAAVITAPDWIAKPTGDDVRAIYPKPAAAAGTEGRATIRCSVTAEGALVGCGVVGEDPTGGGFGEAALSMAPLFKMRPISKDGRPVAGGVVQIPIRFILPTPAPAQTAGLTAPVTRPDWRRKPTADEIARAYPRKAQASAPTGETTLRCVINFRGRFDTCDVTQETPANLGFGPAAVRVASLFELAPVDGDGAKVAGRAIYIPIRFNPPPR